ncbi:P-loop containing nucleoside triphosphate hydrolase protein [Halenospora varia]|nr:P-loop containing nucleoside triphosphate hydrolase protein [Halenospora varia]
MAFLFRRSEACPIQVQDRFGPAVHGCNGDFDFTLLFQEGIMIIPLMGMVILTMGPRFRYLLSQPVKAKGGWHHIAKLLVTAVLAVNQLLLLGFWAKSSTPKTRLTLATGALVAATTLLSVPLSHLEHTRSIRPSSILIVSLLFSTLFDIVRTRTLWAIADNRLIAVIFSVSVGVRILLFLLEAKGKRSLLKLKYQDIGTETTTGIIGQSLFWWLNPLLRRGYKDILSIGDLMTLDDAFVTTPSGKSGLLLEWEKTVSKGRTTHALLFAAMKYYKWTILVGILPRAAQMGFFFAQPYLVGRTTMYVSDLESPKSVGYGLIGAFAFVYGGIAVATTVSQHKAYRLVAMLRGSLIEIIYSKTMVMEATAIEESAPVTLMSADIERIGTGGRFIHDGWACIAEIPLALYLLWRELGVASMAPLGVAILAMVGAVAISAMAGERQDIWLQAIQSRIDATGQMLGTMKGVKMTGLTDKLSNMISIHRDKEIRKSEKFRELLIFMVGISFSNVIVSPVLCFAIYSILAKKNGTPALDTTKAFTSIALFNVLALPIQNLVEAVAGLATAVGSIERINRFLLEEPRKDGRTRTESISSEKTFVNEDGDSSFEMVSQKRLSNGSLLFESRDRSSGWTKDKPNVVSGLSFRVQPLSLTMIVGPVGCGKSTFINALLGETPIFDGFMNVNTSAIAYCAQTCWLKNDTVQSNILGESQFDLQWYNTVLRACGLDHDIKIFPNGDQSMVGSKGAVLSGGQKQRIAIARAVYSKLRTVILDDVFSGLDPTTEDHVFNYLLGTRGIWREAGTTVIMTTNNINRLPYADNIIVLGEDGKLAQQGTFSELNSSKGYVQSLDVQDQDTTSNKTVKGAIPQEPLANPANEIPRDEGDRRTGDTTIYVYYFKVMGFTRSSVFVLGLSIYVVFVTYPHIWVEKWAHHNEIHPNEDLGYWLGIYAMLAVGALVSIMAACWHLMKNLVARAARNFHSELLSTVLNAPMSFFSTTDVGVTLNRFSQDLQLIDMELPLALLNSVLALLTCIAQLVVICVTTKYLAAVVPLAMFIFYMIQRYYLRTSRQLRFLDIESKSPLFSHFLESLSGLVTIRSYGWVERYCERNAKHINDSQKPFYLLYCIQRWLELVVSLSVAGLAILLVGVAVATKGQISAGFIGVALINIVTFSGNLQALLTHWTVLETSIGAVSRIRTFVKTPSENRLTENSSPPDNWPDKGSIEFKEVVASYKADGDPVLKGISLRIPGGKKVGICGRTGSGKSSLVSTLFRILDLDSGSIFVDGIDLSTLPRQTIRSRLIVVPQDPYLFDGSVRLNVDPSESVPDDAIIEALRKVQLWDTIKESGGLSARVTNDYFSHGQKQLLCIASAMLRKGNILVLDEATSSVDAKTDAIIASLIREEFAHHTIIAIAHRLDSIIDFDQVIFMDKGEIKESGNPKALVATPGSHFRDLYLDLNQGRKTNRTPLPF